MSVHDYEKFFFLPNYTFIHHEPAQFTVMCSVRVSSKLYNIHSAVIILGGRFDNSYTGSVILL